MKREQQKQIVEALILASGEPLSAARIANIVPHLTPAKTRDVIQELNAEYESGERSFEIWEVAGGYQIRTRPVYAGYVKQLQKERPLRLSRAALESLAVIAYKQPVTRAEVEHVRGVDVGPVMRSLVERGLVKIAGHRDVPGRPMLYGTTRRFLEVFGLTRLEDLPTLREIEDLVIPEELAHLVSEAAPGVIVGDGEAGDEDDGGGSGEDPEGEPSTGLAGNGGGHGEAGLSLAEVVPESGEIH